MTSSYGKEELPHLGLRAIGANVLISKKVSFYGAGSVVTKDVPANSVAAGNPAKVIRYLK